MKQYSLSPFIPKERGKIKGSVKGAEKYLQKKKRYDFVCLFFPVLFKEILIYLIFSLSSFVTTDCHHRFLRNENDL